MLDFFKKIAYSLKSAFKRGADPQEVSMGGGSGIGMDGGGFVSRIPNPVYVKDLFDGKVTIIVFGAPFNWNYAGASRAEMEAKNPGITTALEEVMRKYNIHCALVPKPAFNAKVVTDEDLPNELLPNFFRGADADGVILKESGDAYFLASADCLAAVIFDPQTGVVAALHCGRNALVDRMHLNAGDRRKHETVIDAACDALDEIAYDEESLDEYKKLQVFLAAGIRPETFNHPIHDEKYGAANKRMIDHLVLLQSKRGQLPPIVTDVEAGKIDLFALARHQLAAQDITEIAEDEFDTATTMNINGGFVFHSNRRDESLRNLVVIRRN